MPDKSNLPRKQCIVCGRPMTWRRKWALTWHGVKFCSERCRRQHHKADGAAVQGSSD